MPVPVSAIHVLLVSDRSFGPMSGCRKALLPTISRIVKPDSGSSAVVQLDTSTQSDGSSALSVTAYPQDCTGCKTVTITMSAGDVANGVSVAAFTGLVPNTKYVLKVSAVDRPGAVLTSASFTTGANTGTSSDPQDAPAVPTVSPSSAGSGGGGFAIQAFGSTSAVVYTVSAVPTGCTGSACTPTIITSTSTTPDLSTLEDGKRYNVSVVATDTDTGKSSKSTAPITITTPAAVAPSVSSVVRTGSSAAIAIQASQASGFQLTATPASCSSSSSCPGITSTTTGAVAVLAGLQLGVAYNLNVTARGTTSPVGRGSVPAQDSAPATSAAAPAAPTLSRVAVGDGGAVFLAVDGATSGIGMVSTVVAVPIGCSNCPAVESTFPASNNGLVQLPGLVPGVQYIFTTVLTNSTSGRISTPSPTISFTVPSRSAA